MLTEEENVKFDWTMRGAEQGNVLAQFNLGVAYLTGVGIEKDYLNAYKWLHLASGGGYSEAKEVCNTIEKKMDPDDVVEAQRLANEWVKNFKRRKL